MERVAQIALTLVLLVVAAVGQERSLGDIAREQRQQRKQPARVVTNDDLVSAPPADTAVVTAPATRPSDQAPAAKAGESSGAAYFAEQSQKFTENIQKQKSEIALLEAEIAKLQHDLQVQSTNYYIDAGSRLRSPEAWVEKRKKADAEIAKANDKLKEARQHLDDLLEQARKLGFSTTSLE